ncbi:MAG: hypothetical protein ACRDRL_00245, partial [Sciscionella sp.]
MRSSTTWRIPAGLLREATLPELAHRLARLEHQPVLLVTMRRSSSFGASTLPSSCATTVWVSPEPQPRRTAAQMEELAERVAAALQ